MATPEAGRYRTTNWKSYDDGLKQCGSLLDWLDKDMASAGNQGGATQPPAGVLRCSGSVLSRGEGAICLPLRDFTGMAISILTMVGPIWLVTGFATLNRRAKTLAVQVSSRRAPGPFNLLLDSPGIKIPGDREWLARNHGKHPRRQYRKVHLMMDTVTGDIRALAFTS